MKVILMGLLLSGVAFADLDYEKLRKSCKDSSCCLASVNKMKNNKHPILSQDQKCPKGYSKNQLKCPGSKIWCEKNK